MVLLPVNNLQIFFFKRTRVKVFVVPATRSLNWIFLGT
jgi:hypothetical protein